MSKTVLSLAVSGILFTQQALALDPVSPANNARRQLISCMTKQMSASKTVSYNEASKMCKEQQRAQSAPLVAADTARGVAAR